MTSNYINQFINGSLTRREFLSFFLKTTATATITTALGCVYSSAQIPRALSPKEDVRLQEVLSILFPTSADSPGASEINALSYFHFVMLDSNVSDEDKQLILNGGIWLDEECLSLYSLDFVRLREEQKEKILETIVQEGWGENWISLVLNYLFEALLSDPIYGSNPNGVGWQWLEHEPGLPRPSIGNSYRKRFI